MMVRPLRFHIAPICGVRRVTNEADPLIRIFRSVEHAEAYARTAARGVCSPHHIAQVA